MQNIEDMEDIYLKYGKLIYKYLFCLTHDSEIAEELTQDTFVCAIKQIENFKGNSKVSTWLCKIAKNLWYKQLKKEKKANVVNIEHISKDIKNDENIEEEVIQRVAKQDLYKKIENLPKKVREIIYLRIIGEFSFKQIGEMLGKNENWARVTFYRGKEKMKEGDCNEKK